MLKSNRSVVSNNPIHRLTGALFRLKTRPTSHYVDLSQLIKCRLLLHAPNHQVKRGFRHVTTQILNVFYSYLSCRFYKMDPGEEFG